MDKAEKTEAEKELDAVKRLIQRWIENGQAQNARYAGYGMAPMNSGPMHLQSLLEALEDGVHHQESTDD